jgi:S1-C subfamily serine protease
VVGTEPNKDLAVLRIQAPAEKLKPLAIGTSNQLLVGQKVLAIGNPFGLDQTLTVGVVSALGRQIKSVTDRTIQDVIQTDAAVNPGNSGGPLLDSRGQLIGVNTAIVSPSGAYAGIGFAVPVDTVNRVVPQLIRFGKVIRPGLGVRIVSDSIARRLGVEGVIIAAVPVKSGAADAGLQGIQRNWRGEATIGDVIIGINDQKVTNGDDLGNALEQYKVGDTVTVRYLRDGNERTARVQLQRVE